MTTFQNEDQQQQQQEQHQCRSDTEKEEVIYTTNNSNNKSNKNKSNRKNNNNEIIVFEEKTYVNKALVQDDAIIAVVGDVDGDDVQAEEVTDVVVETEVPLHIAVCQCWPKLFPTKSSSKKYIRKGLFTVASLLHQNHHHHHHPIKVVAETKEKTYYQKGKCDTKIKVGDIIRRKIQKGEQQQQQHQQQKGQDELQVQQHVQHFRNRGTSTSEIIQRAIGGRLCIAYIDQYIAVVIKPYGMPVNKIVNNVNVNDKQKSNQQQQQKVISLHELLLHCMPQQQTQINNQDVLLRRPACIHRLDQVTYGLVIVALTSSSARYLSKQFECSKEDKILQKRYRAIVYGHVEMNINEDSNNNNNNNNNNVDSNDDDQVGRSYFIKTPLSGKECITEYRTVRHFIVPSSESSSEESTPTLTPKPMVQLTLVDLFPHTGRTHQLRKHMEYIGHPIVGDRKYNDLNKNGIHNNKSKSKRRIDKISDDDNGVIISYLEEEEEVVSLASSSSIVDDVDVVGDVTAATAATATAAQSKSKIPKKTIVMMDDGQQQHQIPLSPSPPSLSLSYYTPLMLAAIELQFLHPKFASEKLEVESSTAPTATADSASAASEYNYTSTISTATTTATATATATADHNSTTTTPTTTTNDGVSIASASGSGCGVATATTSASASDYHVFAKDSETYIDRSKRTLKVKIDMPIEMKQLILRSL